MVMVARRDQGQALILTTATMFLIVVMVIFTLSIGQRTRDRMELQTTADAAAYSEAVAAARTFNSMAILNRAQIAHAVSLMGTLAIISWATMYWSAVDQAAQLFRDIFLAYAVGIACACTWFPFCFFCPSCALGALLNWLNYRQLQALANALLARLRTDTTLYATETLPRYNATVSLGATGGRGVQDALHTKLVNEFNAPILRPQLIGLAKVSSAYSTVTSPGAATAAINNGKLANAIYVPASSPVEPWLMSTVADGSREHPFVPNRSVNPPPPPNPRFGNVWFDGIDQGYGYTSDGYQGLAPTAKPKNYYAEDFGINVAAGTKMPWVIFTVPCGLPFPIGFWAEFAIGRNGRAVDAVVSGPNGTDHGSDPGGGRWRVHGGPVQHAWVTPFPPFYDYNWVQLQNQDELNGQPTQSTLFRRAYDPAHPYVWDLNITAMPMTGATLQTSNVGAIAGVGNVPTDQVAIGKGVIYYNRGANGGGLGSPPHYSEPPNLFAPYWRAALTRWTIDRPRPGSAGPFDAQTQGLLNGVDPEYGTLYQQLVTDGYRGFQ